MFDRSAEATEPVFGKNTGLDGRNDKQEVWKQDIEN